MTWVGETNSFIHFSDEDLSHCVLWPCGITHYDSPRLTSFWATGGETTNLHLHTHYEICTHGEEDGLQQSHGGDVWKLLEKKRGRNNIRSTTMTYDIWLVSWDIERQGIKDFNGCVTRERCICYNSKAKKGRWNK
jgi:hypothetical protein